MIDVETIFDSDREEYEFMQEKKEQPMKEQIEEMAKALTNYEYKLCERLPKDKCLLTSAIHAQVSCDYCKIAEFLYNAGYRKQKEGEWIDQYQGMYVNQLYKCSVCGETAFHDDKRWFLTNFCPNCGAPITQEFERRNR